MAVGDDGLMFSDAREGDSVPSRRSGTRRDVAARDGRLLTLRVEFFVKIVPTCTA